MGNRRKNYSIKSGILFVVLCVIQQIKMASERRRQERQTSGPSAVVSSSD